jgi:hypothetical protein
MMISGEEHVVVGHEIDGPSVEEVMEYTATFGQGWSIQVPAGDVVVVDVSQDPHTSTWGIGRLIDLCLARRRRGTVRRVRTQHSTERAVASYACQMKRSKHR